MLSDIVEFEYDETLVKQIDLALRIEQVIVLAAFIVRFKHIQKVVYIEILLPHIFLPQDFSVILPDELIERIERRDDVPAASKRGKEHRHGIRQGDFFGP